MNKPKTWYDNLYVKLTAYADQSSHVERFCTIEHKIYEAVVDAQDAAKQSAADSAKACKNPNKAKKDPDVDDNGLPLNIKTPSLLVLTNVISLSAYLASIFAFQRNVFTVTDYLPKLFITDAVKAKLAKDSSRGRWALQMLKAGNNAAMFNFGPVVQRVDTTTSAVTIEALCPYNTQVDESVPLEDVGAKAGYGYNTQLLNIPELFKRLRLKDPKYITPAGEKFLKNIGTLDFGELAKCTSGFPYTYPPGILDQVVTKVSKSTDWSTFHLKPEDSRKGTRTFVSGTSLAVTEFYIRSLPEWLELPKSVYPASDLANLRAIPIYIITLIADTVLSVEPMFESHNLLPLSVGSVRASTSLGVPPSFAELLIPSQDASTKLDNASMAGIRRLFGRHGIYNSNLVSEEELRKPLAKAEIPQDKAGQQQAPSQAFVPTAFDGQGLGALLGSMSQVHVQAARAVGNTPQTQGSRIPGNKLAVEAQRETVLAEAPFRVYAMTFQETCVGPQRHLLRSNLGHLINTMVYYNRDTGRSEILTPEQYREAEVDFEISDGLSPSSKRASPDSVNAVVNLVASIPALQTQMDLLTLMKTLAISLGFEDINDVPAASQAQLQYQTLQALGGGGTPAGQELQRGVESNTQGLTGGSSENPAPTT